MCLKAVFGLGNPGEKYKNTRHNVGFMVIERFLAQVSKREATSRVWVEFDSQIYKSGNLLLIKPMVFINLSGAAVEAVCQHFNLNLKNCLIIYDDLDIELGELKAKYIGGAGGHRGMQSIINTMGTDKIPRLKIGTGDNIDSEVDITTYVLSEFTEQERKRLDPILDQACEAIELFRDSEITDLMNKLN